MWKKKRMTRADKLYWNDEPIDRIVTLLDNLERRMDSLATLIIDIQKKHIELMLRVDTLERR